MDAHEPRRKPWRTMSKTQSSERQSLIGNLDVGGGSAADRLIRPCFFVLGAGSTVTFNAAVMAVAYFRLVGGLGSEVLANLALSQNVTLTLSMVLLTVATTRVPPLSLYVVLLTVSFTYATGLNLSLAWAAATSRPLGAAALYALIAANGLATGCMQARRSARRVPHACPASSTHVTRETV